MPPEPGWWPALSLQGTYGSAFSNASSEPFNDQLQAQRAGGITLGLTIPLFQWRRNTQCIAQSAPRASAATDHARGSARRTVGVEVRRVREDFKSAQEQLSAAETQQQTAERAVHAAEERFKSGVAPLVELTQARTLFLQAKTARAATRSNLLLQKTLLDYTLGNLDHRPPLLK